MQIAQARGVKLDDPTTYTVQISRNLDTREEYAMSTEQNYDYIIVGASSVSCSVAGRLTPNP
ncbi:hypothetical protein NUACC21_04430 [Scytonema sp. NUACC21]